MNKLIAENQPVVGLSAAALIAFLIVFHFSDYVVAHVGIALVIGGGVLLALSEDTIDKRIGYAVCAANAFLFVMSFFASPSELTDPGRAITVRVGVWIIFLTNLWSIGRLLDSKNREASRVLRIGAGTLFIIGIAASYLQQIS